MDTRPRKRQRKLILSNSDGEEDAGPGPRLEQCKDPSNWQLDKSRKLPGSKAGTEKALPPRSKRRGVTEDGMRSNTGKGDRENGSKESSFREASGAKKPRDLGSGPLSTFLSKRRAGSQHKPVSQQELRPDGGLATVVASRPDDADLDSIEDDSEDCSDPKHLSDDKNEAGTQSNSAARPLGGKQSFRVTTNGTTNKATASTQSSFRVDDCRPWAEKYGPSTLEELAVNKRKIIDVKKWMENVFSGKERKRLLILKGPSGSGKTATVEIIARSMGLKLLEWRNPVGSDLSHEGYSSMSSQFTDFLGRSSSFGNLDLAGNTTDAIKGRHGSQHSSQALPRKLVLVDEFPSISTSSLGPLRSFRACMLEYLASHSPSLMSEHYNNTWSNGRNVPLVLIITEIRTSQKVAAGESFTAHKLLGPEILGHDKVSVIDFNPIATTIISKALEMVLRKEARHSGRKRIPGSAVLKILGEAGDVRSAIGSLEFLCARSRDADDWSGRVAAKSSKGARASQSLTKMEEASISTVAHRETSLGLFHAVGKVVYNKRETVESNSEGTSRTVQPPHHLAQHARARVSKLNLDGLIDETGTDTGTFVAALHENYVLSCEGNNFLDTMNGCLDAISDTDILYSPRGARLGGGSYLERGATESLRHDDLSFHVAVRGLLFALPDPVKRASHPELGSASRGSEADTYRMHYPTSMRILNQIEETGDLIERWTANSQSGASHLTLSDHASASSPWTQQGAQHLSQETMPYRETLNTTKMELVLERLPYLHKIEQCRCSPRSSPRILNNITQFHRFSLPVSGIEEGEVAHDAVQMDDVTIQHRGPLNAVNNPEQAPAELDRGVKKLFLIEDDIEDD